MNRRIVTTKYKHDHDTVNVGVALPFTGKGIFIPTTTTSEQLKFNLIDLVMTNKGERFFDPNYGCDLRKLLFEPMVDDLDIGSVITSQLDTYLPQISILEINQDTNTNEYTLLVQLKYKIKHTSVVDVVTIGI